MKRTYVLFALLGLIWGSNFIYMKWATALIAPSQIVFLRVLFGFIPLAFVAWRRDVIKRSQVRHLPHFAVMGVVATAFYYFAIVKGTALLPSGVAGVLGGSIAIFTTISSLIFLPSEKLNTMMAVGVVLGFAGIALISRPWEGQASPINLTGVAWMLGASIVLGLSYVYVRRILSPHNLPPVALATWQMGIALVILIAVPPFTGITSLFHDSRAALGVVVGLGVLGTGTAFLLYYYLLQELGAVAASGSTYITPTVALLIGWIAGEKVGLPELGAIALILLSIAMLQIGRLRSVASPRLQRTTAS